MPRFAANLTNLFTELALPDRVTAAAEAGFDAVEVQFPYDSPAMEIRNALGRTGLPLVLINAPPPNYTGGTSGFAAVPGGQQRFQHDFRRALRYAQTLKAEHIHVMSGAAWGDQALDTMVANLKWACAHAPEQSLTIEPMNAEDLPGYFMCSFRLAMEVLEAVDAPNLSLQFDTYHVHRITGDVLASWTRFGAHVGHVQVAGVPDQGEPDEGAEIDFAAFYAALGASGYTGWVGADYRPRRRTSEGLGWLEAARAAEGLKRPA
ncbi:TIM barrel protein [Pseudooceanicola sp. CBS1P-1]|uniref:TIM barrel protein n=1 Tax=Pseudooceanicola albus TaxID=2692189 RepID=A0A6L7FXS1_9RHOB|nr:MULTISPECIES: TIM barrel protein [Pseudooceanicola]MBT9384023.1 TIM barrel protein [Pseudooceanicola endophyticus]MXN16565.1 TIM barrel protein [Pseudooceanicola albus]